MKNSSHVVNHYWMCRLCVDYMEAAGDVLVEFEGVTGAQEKFAVWQNLFNIYLGLWLPCQGVKFFQLCWHGDILRLVSLNVQAEDRRLFHLTSLLLPLRHATTTYPEKKKIMVSYLSKTPVVDIFVTIICCCYVILSWIFLPFLRGLWLLVLQLPVSELVIKESLKLKSDDAKKVCKVCWYVLWGLSWCGDFHSLSLCIKLIMMLVFLVIFFKYFHVTK